MWLMKAMYLSYEMHLYYDTFLMTMIPMLLKLRKI